MDCKKDGWMGDWMDGWTDSQYNLQMDSKKDGWMIGWICMDRREDNQM